MKNNIMQNNNLFYKNSDNLNTSNHPKRGRPKKNVQEKRNFISLFNSIFSL